MGGQAGSAEDLPTSLQRIERKIDDLVGMHTHTREIGEELIITPEMLNRASHTQLMDWVQALRVEIPRSVLRTAVQRHLQKYGELVERVSEDKPAKPPKPPKKAPPPPPWKPEKGMKVRHRKDPSRIGLLGITAEGEFRVRWKDGAKTKYSTEAKLIARVQPHE